MWAIGRRSAVLMRLIAPAMFAAVTVAAAWTTLALAVPALATGDAAALIAIAAVGLVTAAMARHGAGRRALPLALIASAGAALLIFVAISSILPAVPGFVSNDHPPTYTDVTRLVDPITEFAVFVLLAAALGVHRLRARALTRRIAVREQHRPNIGGPNEMVVEDGG